MDILNQGEKKKEITKFIICTRDYSGLGFAKILLDGNTGRGNPRENREPVEVILAVKPKDTEDDMERFDMVGEGMVEKVGLEEIFKIRKEYKDFLWVFDGNHNSEYADLLRSEGFTVFGGDSLTDKMEHDRSFGMSLIEKAGLDSPPSTEFQDKADALAFLDENYFKAYVFKPDEPNEEQGWCTTAPENDNDEKANREIYEYLESTTDEAEDVADVLRNLIIKYSL